MNLHEHENERNRLTNLIALKKTLLAMFKSHSADKNRIESIESKLRALEDKLAKLELKK